MERESNPGGLIVALCRRCCTALGKTPLTINPLIGDGLIASNYPESLARVLRKNVGKNNRERVGEAVQPAEREMPVLI